MSKGNALKPSLQLPHGRPLKFFLKVPEDLPLSVLQRAAGDAGKVYPAGFETVRVTPAPRTEPGPLRAKLEAVIADFAA